MKDPIVQKSKHLSLVLRHKPESVGLTLNSAGWASTTALLSAMKWSMTDLELVVAIIVVVIAAAVVVAVVVWIAVVGQSMWVGTAGMG